MIIGENILLEEIDPANIEWMRQQRNDPEMRKYFREWKDISKDQQEEWYKRTGNNSNLRFVYFQIMWLDKGFKTKELSIDNRKLIGCCNLSYIDWHIRSAEFGIFIDRDYLGKGLGHEALFMMFNYGFGEMGLNKIWGEIYDNNLAIKTYEKLGMKHDGISRDSYFSEGRYGNSYLMSILASEWKDKHGKVM